jgi:ketosteroid isomerase-like protein
MSENVELVREAIAAWLAGDAARAAELTDPGIVSRRMPPIPDPGTYHGLAGVQQMYDDWTSQFGAFEMEIGEYVDAGDRVVVEFIQSATGKVSGAAVVGRFWFVFTIANRRLVGQDVYNSRAEALEAAQA